MRCKNNLEPSFLLCRHGFFFLQNKNVGIKIGQHLPLELMCINVYNKDKEDNTMPMTSKEMIKLLEANGFIYVKSGDGSHRKFRNPKTGRVTQVPFHNRALGKGLEHRILKQAGLK